VIIVEAFIVKPRRVEAKMLDVSMAGPKKVEAVIVEASTVRPNRVDAKMLDVSSF
jgi:hypothetical protein